MGFYDITDTRNHNGEHLYLAARYSEANWLKGNLVKFYPNIEYHRDIESDYHAKLGEPVEINIVLEEYPQSELEKKNQIFETDDLPYQARISNIIWPRFLAYRRECQKRGMDPKAVFNSAYTDHGIVVVDADFYVRVSKFSIVEFPYTMEEYGTQRFRVTKVLGDQSDPFIWLCHLAPHRDQFDLLPNTEYVDNMTNYDPSRYQVGHTFLSIPNKWERDEDKIPKHPRDINDSPIELSDIPPWYFGQEPKPPDDLEYPEEDTDAEDVFIPDENEPSDKKPDTPFEPELPDEPDIAPEPPDSGDETPEPLPPDITEPEPPSGLEEPEKQGGGAVMRGKKKDVKTFDTSML